MTELTDTPKQSDLIYDVGMHKGEDTEFYLRKGFRVIAFEADPGLASLCRDRLKKYIDRGQLKVVEGAIVDLTSLEAGQEKVRFYRNEDISVWGTVHVNRAERNVRRGTSTSMLDVAVIDFAQVMRQFGVPHYMKIDIEGLDMVCVNVLSQFRERPDYVSMESDLVSFANVRREIDALVALGYDAFQAVEQSRTPHAQIPPYPAGEGEYVPHRFEKGSTGLFGSELGEKWKSRSQILRQYRAIFAGYYLLGNNGVMTPWKFRGAARLRRYVARLLGLITKAKVPGWYDTHARHSSLNGHPS